jgi:hypothetical protein
LTSAARVLEETLNRLEDMEAATLAWGFPEATLSHDELSDAIYHALDATGSSTSVDDVIRDMEDAGLVFRALEGDREGYRTRIAETVRLLATLRQLFPRHVETGTWRAAPQLVHDYRIVTRARRFPQRDISASDAVSTVARAVDLPSASVAALHAVTGTTTAAPRVLSGFQVRATTGVLAATTGRGGGATVVCAGTGAGKTLAFYLPALAAVAPDLGSPMWTKVVAVYPRIELLRDQLTSAVREVAALDGVGARPVRLGALFGSTPHSAYAVEAFKWRRLGDSFACPLLRCPTDGCSGDLMWPESSRRSEHEQLRCTSCHREIDGERLALTRKSLQQSPPDILFTTTETLHRQLSSPLLRSVIGARPGAPRPPRLLLLDEAHTYSGLAGAQASLVLRRWRHAVGGSPHVVALSATLTDPRGFVERLASVPNESITTVQAEEDELVERGSEHLVALRGNPMSGSALLSTTIQAAMLLRRMLDRQRGTSRGLYGSRLFAFTDNLDVTNRLLANLRDAEARTPWGAPRRSSGGTSPDPLAALRLPEGSDVEERRGEGQVWDAPLALGHELTAPGLVVTRTSSQDSGVDPRSDIVVATASLEVGFDDDRVGTILQHKAPRNAAGFIQRKGRAGRSQEMRPLLVAVLSDYGRDRIAYQGYDQLLSPSVSPEPLPVDNLHALRMQATAAALDYLAVRLARLGDQATNDLWTVLASPPEDQAREDRWRPPIRRAQEKALQCLRGLLANPAEQERLADHLRDALRLDERQLATVMWLPPRSLMLAALPTLLRRLEDGWEAEIPVARNPLPEYLAANLFTDLNVPEVVVTAPRPEGEEQELLPVRQALTELTPGRLTRRFSISDVAARHWIPIDPDQPGIDIATFIDEQRELGEIRFRDGSEIGRRRLLRPLAARLFQAPLRVRDSQSSRLDWRTVVAPTGAGDALGLPATRLRPALETLIAHTHAAACEVDLARFAVRATADDPQDADRSVTVELTESGESVAVGYRAPYDAIRVPVTLPADLLDRITRNPELLRALRRRRFEQGVQALPALAATSTFTRGWIAELYLAAYGASVAANGCDGPTARGLLRKAGVGTCLERALGVIFEARRGVDEGDDNDDTRAVRRLREAIRRPEVGPQLDALAGGLADPITEHDLHWVGALLRVTLAAAVREAAQRLCPRVDVESLELARDDGPDDDSDSSMWLIEASLGGAGVVEEVARAARDEPAQFADLILSVLGPTEFERAHADLVATATLAETDEVTAELIERARGQRGARASASALDELVAALRQHGITAPAATRTALAARVLRPGATLATLRFAGACMARWDAIEEAAGVEIDARAVAYALRLDEALESTLVLGVNRDLDDRWRYSQVYGLLWPRGHAARASALEAYSPYAELPRPERLLAVAASDVAVHRVDVATSEWRSRVDEALGSDGECVIHGSPASVRGALHALALEPVDLGLIQAYPRVAGVDRFGTSTQALLRLDEIA